jgi:hypothetical protein
MEINVKLRWFVVVSCGGEVSVINVGTCNKRLEMFKLYKGMVKVEVEVE